MPTLWSHISTSGPHKTAEAPGGFCEEIGSTDMHLHRRPANLEFSEGGSQSDLAHLIAKMIAAKAAVFQAPLHYRALQHQKNSLDFQRVPLRQKVILDVELLDLDWWVNKLPTANTRPVKRLLPNILI